MTKSLRTSIFISGMIVATLLAVNLLTSAGYLWCVYPILGVLWWPLSAYFTHRMQPLRYALCGTGLLCVLFVLAYAISTPGAHPWFVYPVLAVLWWPLSVWGREAGARRFSLAGAGLIAVTLLAVNLLTAPGFWWWVYPTFFVVWWPLSVYLGKRAGTMTFAAGSAAAAFLFLALMHRLQTPHAVPWYLFALLPLAWWPVSRALAPRMGAARFALVSGIVFAAYYTALTALLYTASDLVSLFALGAAAWLTYALGISKYRESSGFAALNALLLAGYFVLMHRVLTPGAHAWYWYTYFPLGWWVYAVARRDMAFRLNGLLTGTAMMLLYYGVLNRWLSPGVPWIVFLTGPAAAAVVCAALCPKKAWLKLSVWLPVVLIAYFAAINWLFTPHVLWAVYPAFVLLWWPLSMVFFRKKE